MTLEEVAATLDLPTAEDVADEPLALWCDDCQEPRTLDGRRFDNQSYERCGYNYGEGLNSHLNVRPLFARQRVAS